MTNPTNLPEATNQIKKESMERSDSSYQLSAMSYEKSHPKVTFFILGWIAERLPHMVREIQSRGHEVASHGYNHNLCNQQSHSNLIRELSESKKLLEDITGSQIMGFRAPSFSINDDILKNAEDFGYLYDSSYNSFGLHSRYGQISLNGHSKKGIAHQISDNFFELPISNLNISYKLSAMNSKPCDGNRFVLPWGGGAYFRLLPLPVFTTGLKNILKKENAYLFYLHPWELDSGQPKVANASPLIKFKHYTNIRLTEIKLKKLIKNLGHCKYITCSQYLD
jgi:polysaccharide deacetylase family protein (PEP-CTERM system associated)